MKYNLEHNKGKTIAILGGSGFVGKALLLRLAQDGYKLKVLTRHKSRHKELDVYPNTNILEANVHDGAALITALSGCDIVINLIGILHQDRFGERNSFQHIHVDLVRKIIKACDELEVSRLMQVSAINANSALQESEYLRSKGEAENMVLVQTTHKTQVTVVRPSIIFGENDSFINMFAAILRLPLPFLPLACADFKLAPIAVEDVANIMAALLDDEASYGKVYNLCGQETYTLHELVAMIAKSLNSKVRIIPLTKRLSKIQAKILGMLPGRKFTLDNYYSMQYDATGEGKDSVIVGSASLKTRISTIVNQDSTQDKFSNYRAHANR